MDFHFNRSNLINEQAATSRTFAEFFKCVRGDQTIIIYERLFYNHNNQPETEYLVYCNPLKYAIWVNTSKLDLEQAEYVEKSLVYDWHGRNGKPRGAFYPRVEKRFTALQLMIMNSQYDREVYDFSKNIDEKINEPEEEMWD